MQARVSIPFERIQDFCRRWMIREFSLFGSVLREDFRPDSDVDVLLSFDEQSEWSLMDLAQMKLELEELFGRDVDLVEEGTIRNPYRRASIQRSKRTVYAA